jgi:hypothetical protein
MKYADMKTKELKDMVLSCHDAIYRMECYGCHDLLNLEDGIVELERRGYRVENSSKLSIRKGAE